MKRIVSIILAAVVFVLSFSIPFNGIVTDAFAAATDYRCGDNITWSLDTASGILRFEGAGETYSYVTEEAPWRKYAKYITSIIVSEGITHLGNGFFVLLNNVVSISLADSVEEIWSDASLPALETISVSENSRLKRINYVNFASNSKWYAGVPDNSPVYIGPFLLGYKGTAPENTSVAIKYGTKAVNRNAFKGIANITDISFPDTLDYIGDSAFDGTGWYDSLPDGVVYAGNVLYSYKGSMPIDKSELVIKNGTKSVTDRAFYDNEIVSNVEIPSSVEIIGDRAFHGCKNIEKITFAQNCNLKIISEGAFGYANITEIDLPESLEFIGNMAFNRTKLETVYIPSSVIKLDGAFSEIPTMKRFDVSPDNSNYCSDDDGVLYSKDKTVLHFFPSQIKDYEYTIPNGVEYIGDYAFSFSRVKRLYFCDDIKATGKHIFYQCSIRSVVLNDTLPELSTSMFYDAWGTYYLTIPESIKVIGKGSLGYHFDYVYFPAKDVTFADKQWHFSQKTKFFCYEDSTAYEFAQANSEKLSAIILDDENIGDYSGYEYAVNKFKSLSSNKRSKSNYWNAAAIIDNVPLNICKEYQSEIDAMTDEINSALESMKVVWCDYSAVDEAISRANAVDRKLFTDQSLARLDAEVNSVEKHCDVADSDLIKEYVDAIDDAISALDEKIGDYSGLYKALLEAENIERVLYTENSLLRLDEAVYIAKNAEKTDDQRVINSYAQAIYEALKSLEYIPADFSALNGVVTQADAVNRSLYTAESLDLLDKALEAVDYNLTIDNQAQVDEWAKAIENALDNLEYRPADYSAVETQINKAKNLDRRYYSEISLISLDAAVNAVVYGLNVTEQEMVNAFAKSIADAILALKYASVVLRHEPCGVIVSATTKEIKPDTLLSVEEVDPSNYEGTNFAVGGSIRSLHFYDINLVNNAAVIQPDGTVTVKIRIANGVDPNKCKVYHVTEDIVNPLVRFASTLDGNYIVFETDHFSEFAVIEVETVVDSIEVSQLPAKVEYGIGEQIDLTGLKVVASYSDGTSREISDYNVGMVMLNSVGKKKVSVYYTYGNITKTTEFEITVSGSRSTADITENGKAVERINKKIGLFALYTKASVQLDCNVKNADGCTVRWSSDNSRVVVDKNGKVTFKGLFGAKKAKVTAEVIDAEGNVIAKDTVTVLVYKLSFQFTDSISQTVDIFKHSFIC